MIAKKKPLWKIREELEHQLNILKIGQRNTRSIIITMLTVGIEKGGFSANPIIKSKTVYTKGNHLPSSTHETFGLLKNNGLPLLDPVENIDYDEKKGEGRFNKSTLDVLSRELEIYDQLGQNNLLSNSDRREIEVLREILKKFYGI
ncbi:MAG: hypothetical protein KG003_00925 [Bacteroidetes bacterium]|nr:hypothetical protein [Bacteroidota bacterium]